MAETVKFPSPLETMWRRLEPSFRQVLHQFALTEEDVVWILAAAKQRCVAAPEQLEFSQRADIPTEHAAAAGAMAREAMTRTEEVLWTRMLVLTVQLRLASTGRQFGAGEAKEINLMHRRST